MNNPITQAKYNARLLLGFILRMVILAGLMGIFFSGILHLMGFDRAWLVFAVSLLSVVIVTGWLYFIMFVSWFVSKIKR